MTQPVPPAPDAKPSLEPISDPHTAGLFKLVRVSADKFRRLRASDLPKPWRQANPDLPTMKVPHVGNSLEVLAMDDDAVVRSKPVQLLLRFNNAWLPFRDHDETWGGAEEARQGLEKRIGRYLPAASVDWADAGETTNDLWTRQALGSQNLRRVTPEDGAQPDEAFVSAFEFMSKYRVRDGLLPYGGDAFMSAEGRVVRIRLHGSDYRPGDTGWAHAGFVYRSSSMVWSTLSDHVFKCHYLFMNPVLMSTKRLLPLEQGLRHFLAAFHYRTAAINHGGVFTLVPPGGMFHRTTGFDWETLQHVYEDCLNSFRYETFKDGVVRRGLALDSLGADHSRFLPSVSDGMEYWTRTRAFVDDVCDRSGAVASALGRGRDATRRWWDAIAAAYTGGLPELGEESLRDMLTQVVFTVSATHEHVGNVAQYIRNPTLAAGKLWPGQTIADKQSSLHLCVVGAITGLEMPKLMEDFSHLMPDEHSRQAVRTFQNNLEDWQVELDARNARRVQPFVSFSPRELSCSIAI